MSKPKKKKDRKRVVWQSWLDDQEQARETYWDRYQYLREQTAQLARSLDYDIRRVPGAMRTTKKQILQLILAWHENLEGACLDNCKNMYFCDQKRGHKGQHKDSCGLPKGAKGGLVWPQYKKT